MKKSGVSALDLFLGTLCMVAMSNLIGAVLVLMLIAPMVNSTLLPPGSRMPWSFFVDLVTNPAWFQPMVILLGGALLTELMAFQFILVWAILERTRPIED